MMMKEIDQCPICRCEVINRVIICKDYLVSGKDFEITSCTDCGFQFTNPRPDDHELGEYYKSEDYVSHSESKKGLINRLFLMARRYTLKKKLKTIQKYSSGKRLLDIGCGSGSFLDVCKSAGYEATGLEPDEGARAFALKNYGLEVRPIEEFLQLDENSSDIITLWHVLEHVADLRLYFKRFKEVLSENGTLFIALPNSQCLDAEIYGKFWAAFDVPRHLYHFRQKDIRNIAEQYGFSLEKALPMKLDAFYISLLSEKHKDGKSHLFRAFINGMKSNRYARRHNNNYSSLIYVFKRDHSH